MSKQNITLRKILQQLFFFLVCVHDVPTYHETSCQRRFDSAVRSTQKRINTLIYDDTSEEYSSDTACSIIFDFTENEGEFEVQSYYDRSTTGINANIMARIEQFEENGSESIERWIDIDFPYNQNSIVIDEKTEKINVC